MTTNQEIQSNLESRPGDTTEKEMTENQNIQPNLEPGLKDITEKSDLLLRQLHDVQEELERYHRRNRELENIKAADLQSSSAQGEGWVDDERTKVLAENRRLQALVEVQRKIHQLETKNALNVKLGNILIQGVGSPVRLLSMPRKLGKIWWESNRQAPPRSLGGKSFKKVVATYREGGFAAVEKLMTEVSALPVVQANAYTVLARQLMSDDDRIQAADAAHRAYAIDPKSYRLKWLVFRLHEAENYIEAEAMLDILPTDTPFSESEARQASQLRREAKYFRQIEAEQQPQVLERNVDQIEQEGPEKNFKTEEGTTQKLPYYINPNYPNRVSVDDMFAELSRYEVISFDIFDTAIYRMVEKPMDVFRIMAARSGIGEYWTIRRAAEAYARSMKDKVCGTREVTLHEIYEVLERRYGVDPKWEQAEAVLEIELCRPNAYIKEIFDRLKAVGKTIVFTSDMYLPCAVLEEMLAKCGYSGHEKIYLSNEHKKRKGDGMLQKVLLDDYGQGHSIVHIGDVFAADVEQSVAAGISAIYNADQRGFIREPDMENLAGSFYRAVINNSMGAGIWDKDLHYSHGFRVGGILTLGYCEFIEKIAREKAIEKILFLGRDCDVISKAYRRYYGKTPSEYVGISRYAILGLTIDRNYGDLINRSFFRWFNESNNSRTIERLLIETGFACLVEHLEAFDIDKFQFPASANRRRLEEFFWAHKAIAEAHLSESIAAATQYFSNAIGDAKRVLVVDIGWSGTCISGLRHFLRSKLFHAAPEVFGALMCTSRGDQVTNAVSEGFISAYVYSPLTNMDTTRRFFPGGVSLTQEKQDRTRHPLEYLFTEANPTVVGYGFDVTGEPIVLRGSNVPQNATQIMAMQQGMLDFIGEYLDYSGTFSDIRPVSGYIAINPLWLSIKQSRYTFDVYKDFLYDATPVLFGKSLFRDFGELFSEFKEDAPVAETVNVINGRILFVTSELTYTGGLHSLLRLCKAAVSLGYAPMVWSAKAGNFEQEFQRLGISVEIVDSKVSDKRIKQLIGSGVKLVVCNTVFTDRYVRSLEKALPVVWYVREATNLSDLLYGNAERAATLRFNQNIVCVSEYAAAAIRQFADGPIEVVPNSTEDRTEFALPCAPRSGGKHKFIQLGTIEYRKGYDLFIMAYRSMPETYRDRAELHFAGGFINSGTSFASYIFSLADGDPDIHFHGLIEDEQEKIGLISRMDTVVVASRDESFSLVAIEGAMLSKPVIVSTNVGAKYLIDDASGRIVESENIAALRDAMMAFIDLDETTLLAMGTASRRQYDEHAGMDAHRRDLEGLFSRRITAGASLNMAYSTPGEISIGTGQKEKQPLPEVIVSMTSYPPRMSTIADCVGSLLKQTIAPSQVQLWLSQDQFPGLEADLPAELLALVGKHFRIYWVEGDLGPHKKYLYAMRKFPEALVITVDDDVVYEPNLVETLVNAHLEEPRAIICNRANLVLFRKDGELRSYDGWVYDYRYLRGRLTYQLLPTGIGGVLYPPGAVPAGAFDADAITAACWHGDDLWLKAWTTANGYPVRMPQTVAGYKQIDGSQAVGLWRENVFQGTNDRVFAQILTFFDEHFGARNVLLARIRGVRSDGSFVGELNDSDLMSIFSR